MRTTAKAVGLIIELDATIKLDPFLEVANTLVTELCVPEEYDDTRLELIERWLTAHFYSVRDPRTRSEGVSGISAAYEGSSGMVLESTRYGQQAMFLDTSGKLAVLNRKTKEGTQRKIQFFGGGPKRGDGL